METQPASRGRAPCYQHLSGLEDEQLSDLAAAVHAVIGPWQKPVGRSRAPGLCKAIIVTLFYLRRNNAPAVEADETLRLE